MSFSPSNSTRIGSESGPDSSEDKTAGTQYSRIRLPIGVPGPTRQSSSFSSRVSMGLGPLPCVLQGLLELGSNLVAALAAPVSDQLVEGAQLGSAEDDVGQPI